MELSLKEGWVTGKEADIVIAIQGFCMNSPTLLKFICDPKVNACGTFMTFPRHEQSSEKSDPLDVCFQLRWNKPVLCSLFQLGL